MAFHDSDFIFFL